MRQSGPVKEMFLYLRILGKIGERGDEGSAVCNHDLSTRSCCTNVVRSEIVGQPSHDERTAWEDTSSDQESTAILNHVVVARDEHDISPNGNSASSQHEGASHTIPVGQICNEKHAEEGSNVWRDCQKLCVYCLVSQALDNCWQE